MRTIYYELTSLCFLLSGVPQGFNPPEKLGRFRHTIDLILHTDTVESSIGLMEICNNTSKIYITTDL